MLRAKMVYIERVRVRKEVRCYSLIILRKCSPPRTMFHIHYSSLERCVTLGASMITLRIVVSFFSCKTQGGFPKTFPFAALEELVMLEAVISFIMNRLNR